MKKLVVGLLILSCSLVAFAQFFSNEEVKNKKDEEQPQLVSSLPEQKQKELYIQVCEAIKKAETKAIALYPVKIHHTPEQREQRMLKAKNTQQRLLEHYKVDLAKTYLITLQYLEEVVAKGDKAGWPTTKETTAEE